VDWDGDGRLDIIVGDRPGNIHFFKRLSYGNIYLEEQALVKVAGKPVDVGYNSAPCVVDWDENGLPDLVVGNLSPLPAGLFLFVNRGAPFAPDYQQTDTVLCLGEPIEITTAYPDFNDMNGDGLNDMIVGSSNGKVACFLNSGTSERPLFEQMEYLRANGEDIYICSYVRPSVCDWNDDGTPDLLIADYAGFIYLYTGIPLEGIEGSGAGPTLELLMAHNPVSVTADLSFCLSAETDVSLKLYSLHGRLLRSFDQGMLLTGTHHTELDISGIPDGVYLILCTAGEYSASVTVAVIH